MTKSEGVNGYAQVRANQDVVGMKLIIRGIFCEYNRKRQDTYAMIHTKKRMMLLCKPQERINNDYNKVFKGLINVVKTYGGTFDKLGLVLLQLAKNGAVAGADGDIIGADNPAQIGATKEIVSESMKAAILLDRANGQKYKQLKDDL